MLTVKIVRQTGHEEVYEVVRVTFTPRDGKDLPNLCFVFPDERTAVWTHGTFFIMNEKGHTISKYWLGDNPPPYSAEVQAA